MLYAAISWHRDGYRLAVVDLAGRRVPMQDDYPAHRAGELIADLRNLGEQLTAVVESTNGTLDGRMMAAGLRVCRADPWLLPDRPRFGSVPAEDLARASLRGAPALVRLEPHRGTQTGREPELEAQIVASEAALHDLTAAGRCLSHGGRGRSQVALTFDDGPLPPYTGQVLDVLERYGVPATFFCVGINAGAFAEDLARMRDQGHALGNHTWSHPFLPELTRPQVAEQIDRTAAAIADASGGAAPTLFRPPYGARTPRLLGWLAEFDATTVLWDVAPDDWALRTAPDIATSVLDEVRPGSIILLHDGGGDRSPTVASLPPIIEGLLERGFEFVRVDQMLDRTPSELAVSQ